MVLQVLTLISVISTPNKRGELFYDWVILTPDTAVSQQNLLELALQANPKAIAELMNRSLQLKGIFVKVSFTSDCLVVIAESQETPDQTFVVDFVRKGMTNLRVEAIKRVVIKGQVTGNKIPVWREAFDLNNNTKAKQVPVLQVRNTQNLGTEKLETQPKTQIEVLSKAVNFFKERCNTGKVVLIAGTFLFMWAGVGFKNSAQEGVRIVTSLPGINQKHTIHGELIIKEPEFYGEIGSYCSGKEGYDDIEEGKDIVIKNSKGEIVANSNLDAGKYVNALDSVSETAKEEWKAEHNEELPQILFCEFKFQVDDVSETDFYFVEIGRRKGPTFSLKEMRSNEWKIQLGLGD